MEPRRRRFLLLAERASWTFGLVGLVAWGAYHVRAAAWTEQDVRRFAALRLVEPDNSLWSPERIDAWRKTLSEPAPAPLAVLRIPDIRLEVAILPGTDDRTLDRAVGHIEQTALPGTDGNAGVAGHRDGFFRGLKDLDPGDVIELDTLHGKETYQVQRTWVVDPDDVSVLVPTSGRSLTLVTCYPFYYIGAAPRRFIVRAVLVPADSVKDSPSSFEFLQPMRTAVLAVAWPAYRW